MKNGMFGTLSSVKIKSSEHYEQLGYDENTITDVTVAAKDPGSWGNGLRVGIIDAKADQVLGIVTSGVSVFSAAINNSSATIATGTATTIGITTTSIAIGQEIRGNFIVSGTKVSGISTLNFITIDVATTNSEGGITVPLDFGTLSATSSALVVGAGITQSLSLIHI